MHHNFRRPRPARGFVTNLDRRYADLVKRAAEAANEDVTIGPPRHPALPSDSIGIYGPVGENLSFFWKLFDGAKHKVPTDPVATDPVPAA